MMRKNILRAAVVVLVLSVIGASSAMAEERTMVFGVRPNSVTPQAGYFGWGLSEQLFLTLGLQFVSTGSEVKHKSYDITINEEGEVKKELEDTYTNDVSTSIWLPSLGLKYLLAPADVDAVVPYFAGALFSVIPTADGQDDLEDILDDFWSLGLSAGFGCEYFFSERFSLGGEFGVNFLYGAYEEGDTEVTGDIEATYTALSLNFIL